jgi:hypothetical protein
LVFKTLNIEVKKKRILGKVKELMNDKISIHFRIGDYKKLSKVYEILGVDYYINSLNMIKDVKKVIYFYDDSDKEDNDTINGMISELNGRFSDIEFIDSKKYGLKDWEELLLMSCCKYNIIANSSFSWWAGYFNFGGKVYCPNKWFSNKTMNIKDLYPPYWVKI